jgi:hypothetical protein
MGLLTKQYTPSGLDRCEAAAEELRFLQTRDIEPELSDALVNLVVASHVNCPRWPAADDKIHI